jgi:hypothetical protein
VNSKSTMDAAGRLFVLNNFIISLSLMKNRFVL